MKFIVLGTSEFTINCARAILDAGQSIVALISMPKELLPNNSVNIQLFASKNDIPYHELTDINCSKSFDLLNNYNPDYIFSSWPKIINKEILQIPSRFVIGTHPTKLPYNRGRHPLHWLISLGITETTLSFFQMDANVDNGRILLQIPFSINQKNTILDAVHKMNKIAYESTKELCRQLESKSNVSQIQDQTKSNYWRKRNPYDIILDLRMPALLISRIVRSFTLPYPCAKLIWKNTVIPISKISIVDTNLSREELQRIEPGKIILVDNTILRVKVDDAIIDLVSTISLPMELNRATYIHPPSKYILKYRDEIKKQM